MPQTTRAPSRYATMNDRLTAVIERVRSDESIPALDEANVKQGVILPVLQALGWDPFDIEEVKPEYSVSSGNVDYSLRLDGKNKVFLEAKRPREALNIHQEQLLRYAFAQGVPIAVLTNGLDWWFYRPSGEGNWEERRFCTIDLRVGDISPQVVLLMRFLWQDNVGSGEAVKDAELHLKVLREIREIEQALPKAWEQLINEPDEILVELLNEKVKELCGWEADLAQVKRFLSDSMNLTHAQSIPTRPLIPPQPRMQELGDQHTRRRKSPSPVSFTFCGERFGVKTWSEILTKLGGIVYGRHRSEFSKVSTLGGWHSAGKLSPTSRPKPIGDSGWYVYTNRDRDQLKSMCHKLLAKFRYREQDLVIETT